MTNRHEKKERGVPPAQVARYKLDKGKLPESCKSIVRDYIFDLSQVLHKRAPKTVSTLIAYVPEDWDCPHEHIELYVFGHFRAPYRVIDKLADIFAGLYAKYAILPLVNPVTSAEWAKEIQHNGMVSKNIHENGVVIYEQVS